MEELLESDEALEEELVDQLRLLSPCALHLRGCWVSTSGGGECSGGGERSASAMGSGVAFSFENLLDSLLDSDAATGASSRSGSGSLEVSRRCW